MAITSRWLELPMPLLLLSRWVGAEAPEVTTTPVKRPVATTGAELYAPQR
jgi:hypothetical protein